jgi:hypothetical protein
MTHVLDRRRNPIQRRVERHQVRSEECFGLDAIDAANEQASILWCWAVAIS